MNVLLGFWIIIFLRSKRLHCLMKTTSLSFLLLSRFLCLTQSKWNIVVAVQLTLFYAGGYISAIFSRSTYPRRPQLYLYPKIFFTVMRGPQSREGTSFIALFLPQNCLQYYIHQKNMKFFLLKSKSKDPKRWSKHLTLTPNFRSQKDLELQLKQI